MKVHFMNNNYSKAVAVRLSEMQHAKQITEFQSVYAYENNQRTDEIIGKKAEFIVLSGKLAGFIFTCKFSKEVNSTIMNDYYIIFDEENCSVYARNNSIQLKLWATDLQSADGNKKGA